MKIRASSILILSVSLLALCGCTTVKTGRDKTMDTQAELDLVSSQSEDILKQLSQAETLSRSRTMIRLGDKLTFQIWLRDKISQLSGFPLTLEIGASGKVFLPHVGLIEVVQKTVPQVQTELETILNTMLKDITVIVSRKGEKVLGIDRKTGVELGRHIAVMGHINNPGLYAFEPGLRVRDAIANAGGLAQYAHRRIYLVRGTTAANTEVKRINMNDIFYGNDLSDNIFLAANDAIYVSPVLIYKMADFVTLVLSPITAVRDALWVYDRIVLEEN